MADTTAENIFIWWPPDKKYFLQWYQRGSVQSVVFGKIQSPRFLVHPMYIYLFIFGRIGPLLICLFIVHG